MTDGKRERVGTFSFLKMFTFSFPFILKWTIHVNMGLCYRNPEIHWVWNGMPGSASRIGVLGLWGGLRELKRLVP